MAQARHNSIVNNALRRLFCSSLVLLVGSSAWAQSSALQKGQRFRLSTGATVALLRVEVNRVTSDNTIDVAIILNRDGAENMPMNDILLESAEFCLRYEAQIISAAIPVGEPKTMRVVAPLYQMPNHKQIGFAFAIRDGKCSLEPPFPQALVQQSIAQASKALE